MREGEIRFCSECGLQIPQGRGPTSKTCSPRCRNRRDVRLKRVGTSPGPGSPSPAPRGSPPSYSDPLAEVAARRKLPQPEPQPTDPLPINDPTAVLRRRLLAEAEALLALPHVEGVSINVPLGTVTSLRSTWDVRDRGDHFEAQACAGAPSFEVG